jgi:hypothetical protein
MLSTYSNSYSNEEKIIWKEVMVQCKKLNDDLDNMTKEKTHEDYLKFINHLKDQVNKDDLEEIEKQIKINKENLIEVLIERLKI